MKAKALFTTNTHEIDEALRLDMKPPKPEFEPDYFYFDINQVSYAHKSTEGHINIFVGYQKWTLQWDDDVWAKLIRHLDPSKEISRK